MFVVVAVELKLVQVHTSIRKKGNYIKNTECDVAELNINFILVKKTNIKLAYYVPLNIFAIVFARCC